MSLAKNVNGIHRYFLDRDEIHFEAIAEQFNLDVDEVRKAAYTAEDSIKKPKVIKPQAKAPKKDAANGIKKDRKPSGFLLFCNENRPIAKDLLLNKPKERKFLGKDGNMIEIKVSDFSNKGQPTFTQIGKKSSSMWKALSDKERAEWNEKAIAAAASTETKEVASNKKSKNKESTEDNEDEQEDEEDDATEQDEEDDVTEQDEEEEEKPQKSTKGKGGGRTAKNVPPKKSLPPPKGKKGNSKR